MNCRRIPALVLVLCMAAAAHGQAQEPTLSVVECKGSATVYSPAAFADFVFEAKFSETAREAAMAKALALPGTLRAALDAAEISITTFEAAAPFVRPLPENEVIATLRLRVSISSLGTGNDAETLLARLCDKIAALATASGCTVAGPTLQPADRDGMIRSAIIAATENAYPAGDALAFALKSAVYAVDRVQVNEILWNDPGEDGRFHPSVKAVSCTARVTVLYSVAPPV
jgi:hypothetical protein